MRRISINYCALRYFNVAGADPQARTGQSTAGATHLIKVAVEAALGKRDAVAVFGTDYATPDGTGVRDYIQCRDLAAAHVHALEALVAEPARSLQMNCGYGRGFSVMEVLDAVDRLTNRPIERRARAAPRGRSRLPGVGQRAHHADPAVAAAPRRSRHHCAPRAGVGRPADEELYLNISVGGAV